MVVSAEQERVKSLIVDTVSLLCKNGLHYSKEFSIEGLLGITLDRDNVFLVNIKEIVKNEAYEGSDSCSDTEAAKSKRRKRKKRQRANSVDSDHSSDEDNHVDNASVISNSQEPPSKRLGNVKQETGAEEEDDDEDLVFIKDEPGVDFSQCSFSQVDTNNAQGNSVLGDLSQQLYNPSHQQQQMQWNNTGPPGGSTDQFNNSASSQQRALSSSPPASPVTASMYTPYIPEPNVAQLRSQCSSRPNFAWKLVQAMFSPQEMMGRNVNGRQGKQALDALRMAAVKAAVALHWPTAGSSQTDAEAVYEWKRCVTAIDKGIRSYLYTGLLHQTPRVDPSKLQDTP